MFKKRVLNITRIVAITLTILFVFCSNVNAIQFPDSYTDSYFEESQPVVENTANLSTVFTLLPFILLIAMEIGLLIYANKKGNELKEPKGLLFLSALIPLAGIILYCVYIKKNEELGKICGKLAVFSILIPIIFFILTLVFGALNYNMKSNLSVV